MQDALLLCPTLTVSVHSPLARSYKQRILHRILSTFENQILADAECATKMRSGFHTMASPTRGRQNAINV